METKRRGLALPALALITAGLPAAGAKDEAEGRALYAEHCASCHGADLEGQEDWQRRNEDGTLRAPPHDDSGHTWHHGDALLADYVRLGGAAAMAARGVEGMPSAMPGFGDVLSEAEIEAVLAFIKSHWSERARSYQEAVTEAERESAKE